MDYNGPYDAQGWVSEKDERFCELGKSGLISLLTELFHAQYCPKNLWNGEMKNRSVEANWLRNRNSSIQVNSFFFKLQM